MPFVENCFAALPECLRRDYLDLLTADDVDAYVWLTSGESTPGRYKKIVDVIKQSFGRDFEKA